MKKYKIFHDQRQYAIFVRSNGIERCLRFDEKPMLLQKQLLEAGESPKFLLKHIKQQATVPSRSAASIAGSATTSSHFSTGTQLSDLLPHALQQMQPSQSPHDSLIAIKSPVISTIIKPLPESAVAIYEYKAERDDELDVHIGDRFIILHNESGWCIVERAEEHARGWVPQGCLLNETEQDGIQSDGTNSALLSASELPRIGIALDDYLRMSPNEMNVKRGDVLMVQKRYRHWVLAENGGRRGWIPSCYVSSSGDANFGAEEEAPSTHEIVALPSAEELSATDQASRASP